MKHILFICFSSLYLLACSSSADYAPKPRGYFKIDFPEKKYTSFSGNTPYTFDYPIYAKMYLDSTERGRPFWYNLTYPQFNARVHLSYYPINSKSDFYNLVEDTRKLAFKHTVKATGIDEGNIKFPEHHVYGIYYTIAGNTASSTQFLLTDSTTNFLRGALYFNEKPQADSIQPVVDFIKADINRMIKTLKWTN